MIWNVTFRFVLLCLLFLTGCKSENFNYALMQLPEVETAHFIPTLLSVDAGSFYANGFPTDLRRDKSGLIQIEDFPRQEHWLTRHYVSKTGRLTDGYSTVMPVYLPFAKAIDLDSLALKDQDYANAESPIQVVDVDPESSEYGRRFPLQVSMTRHADSYRPRYLLQVLPTLGVNLKPNTAYAMFATNQLPLQGGFQWQQNPQLSGVLHPDNSAYALSDHTLKVYEPLRDYFTEHNIDYKNIVGAVVWTTGNPVARFHKAAKQIAARASDLQVLPISELENVDDYPEYCVIRGFVDLPGFQKGVPPYPLWGGEVEWGSNGEAIQQYTRHAEFVLTIPKQSPMPDSGFPLLSFVHGAGGRASQVYDRGEFDRIDPFNYPYYIGKAGEGPAQIASERGWASSGLAGHAAYDHIPQWGSLNGVMVFNIFNPEGLAGSYMTMAWERIFFRRVVDRIEVNRELCPEADPGPDRTAFRFDQNSQVNLGQSQGNWISSLMVAADPRPYQGVVFSAAAATWMRLFNNNIGFELAVNTGVINRIPVMDLDDAHPFLMLLEWLLSSVDTVTNLDSLMNRPEKSPPHIIGVSGYNDYMLGETTQRPFFMALGSDLVGEDIGNTAKRTFMPHISIGGAGQLPYPASGNTDIPGYGSRTNVVMRYRGNNPALLYNGHEVLFQSEEIKHQYGCFLEHLGKGVAPVVDVGYLQGGPCFLH